MLRFVGLLLLGQELRCVGIFITMFDQHEPFY
jgi:hypothetical protein